MRFRRAFVLLEMLIAIGLLAVAGLIWIQILRMAAQVSNDMNQQQPAEMRIDQVLWELRNDIWSASALELRDPRWLTLKLRDGRSIDWRAHALWSRELSGEQPRRWDPAVADLSFVVRGPVVLLHLKQKHGPDEQVEFVSESMLLSERSQ